MYTATENEGMEVLMRRDGMCSGCVGCVLDEEKEA